MCGSPSDDNRYGLQHITILLREALLRVWDHPDIGDQTRQLLLKRLLEARNKMNVED